MGEPVSENIVIDASGFPTVNNLPEPGSPGFVRLVDCMGDDDAVADMARCSYKRGTRAVRSNEGLLRYLMRHAHTSPFEGVVFKLHVKCTIYTARQWMRHRTASYNEYSQRYSLAPTDAPFVPACLAAQAEGNRQGRSAAIDAAAAAALRGQIDAALESSRATYDAMIDGGVARETARGVLPVAGWTEFVVVQNLHNLFHFIKLRLDPHAQQEIRAYAGAILDLIEVRVPLCVQAFRDYNLNAMRLTALEVAALRELLAAAGASTDDTAPSSAPRRLEAPELATTNSREQAEWRAKFEQLVARVAT